MFVPKPHQIDAANMVMDRLFEEPNVKGSQGCPELSQMIAILGIDMDERFDVALFSRWGVVTTWFMGFDHLVRIPVDDWDEDELILSRHPVYVQIKEGGASLRIGRIKGRV